MDDNFKYVQSHALEIGLPDWAWTDLVARYSEPHRAYHTLEHIYWALTSLHEIIVPGSLTDKQLRNTIMAILYHDYSYLISVLPGDNERVSACMGGAVAQQIGWDGIDSGIVRLAINATATHEPVEDFLIESMYTMDTDLAGLGSDQDSFDANTQKLKEEYVTHGGIDLKRWARGRIGWINSFLARETIYHTPYAQAMWEQKARDNLAREAEELTVFLKYI